MRLILAMCVQRLSVIPKRLFNQTIPYFIQIAFLVDAVKDYTTRNISLEGQNSFVKTATLITLVRPANYAKK
jgi:hypothetical protein